MLESPVMTSLQGKSASRRIILWRLARAIEPSQDRPSFPPEFDVIFGIAAASPAQFRRAMPKGKTLIQATWIPWM